MFRFIPRRFLFHAGACLQEGSAKVVKSSCPAGTVLNVNVKKSGKDPVALEDNEYPAWLWEVLDPEAQAKKLAQDPLKLRKKLIRKANRSKIKQNNFLQQL